MYLFFIAFSRNERTQPNVVSQARVIEILLQIGRPFSFLLGALGLVFLFIDPSPLGLLRMHNFLHNPVFHDHTTYPVERTS